MLEEFSKIELTEEQKKLLANLCIDLAKGLLLSALLFTNIKSLVEFLEFFRAILGGFICIYFALVSIK